jgi:hypothetical protein
MAVSATGWLTVRYVDIACDVVAWHHAALTGDVTTGDAVQVHEEYHALCGAFGWLNLKIASGAGPVSRPQSNASLDAQLSLAVVDLAAGRALDRARSHLAARGNRPTDRKEQPQA